MTEPPELLVVLPIYNERESITHVIDGWMPVLREHVGNFVILAINDGSTDDTPRLADEFARDTRVRYPVRS